MRSGTIEPVRLVHGQQAVGFLADGHLSAKRVRDGLKRAPTCGGPGVVFDARDFMFRHGAIRFLVS
jgi:hypothetical protein